MTPLTKEEMEQFRIRLRRSINPDMSPEKKDAHELFYRAVVRFMETAYEPKLIHEQCLRRGCCCGHW